MRRPRTLPAGSAASCRQDVASCTSCLSPGTNINTMVHIKDSAPQLIWVSLLSDLPRLCALGQTGELRGHGVHVAGLGAAARLDAICTRISDSGGLQVI